MFNSNFIGNRIAAGRKKVNLTQAELASKISISPQAVGKWERGESIPDIYTLNKLAEIFVVDLNYFSDNTSPTEITEQKKENKETESLFTKISTNLGLYLNFSADSYENSDFSNMPDVKEKLDGSNFKKCKVSGIDLSHNTFRGNSITDSDFSKVNLSNAKILGSEIKNSVFESASFENGFIESCDIRNCDFQNTNFSGIEISISELRNNNIANSNWKLATIKSTQFTEMEFKDLIMQSSFNSCDFRKVLFENVLFENCHFKFCELKKVQFKNCMADKFSYEFLKNCKANMGEIQLK